MDIITEQRNSFQELMRNKSAIFQKIEEITPLKLRPDTELVTHGVNMDMKNSEIQEETHSRKPKESLKIKHSKGQESTSTK